MTRGKHGSSAALRRAEQAEARAARWEAEAREWKREAHRNAGGARRAEALERALARMRSQSVPDPDLGHAAQLAAVEAGWQERWDEAMTAIVEIIHKLLGGIDPDAEYLSANFLRAMQTLPESVARDATAGVWSRVEFRTYMDSRVPAILGARSLKPVLAVALAQGITDGRMPEDILEDPAVRAQLQRLRDR